MMNQNDFYLILMGSYAVGISNTKFNFAMIPRNVKIWDTVGLETIYIQPFNDWDGK